MNKDLDERLVPVGQYRDAMNIQVSTSEGSDVGAVENILGNSLVSQDIVNSTAPDSVCVGTFANEVDNSIYYFASSQKPGNLIFDNEEVVGWQNIDYITSVAAHYVWRDRIYRIQNDIVEPVFVDVFQVTVSFDDRNLPGGVGLGNFDYGLKNTEGIHEGMDCYFFAGPNHTGVTIGNIAVNEMIAGQKIISRKIISVDHNNSTVRFNQNLVDISDISFPNSPGAEWVRSDILDYNYLVLLKPRILNFNCDNIITGINVFDDFLLFTDNDSEPKKINIKRSIAGTSPGGQLPTKLVVPDRNIQDVDNVLVREEHVTVNKKDPVIKLEIEQSSEQATTAVSDYNFTESDGSGSFQLASVGTNVILQLTQFNNGISFAEGEEIRFLNQNSLLSLPNDYDVRCKIISNLSGQPVVLNNQPTGQNFPLNTYGLEILSISQTTPVNLNFGPTGSTANVFNVQRVLDTDSIFEKKFVRFGYRWKYQDGEYSTFSPFTTVVFKPSYFEYDSVLGYNKAMENYLTDVTLRKIISIDIPEDVIQVDLLYSESNSPIVYIVDKIRYNDFKNIYITGVPDPYNNWTANKYKIKSDIIFNAVPENQTLRQWDNVPRKALSQEVTGNRLVYGNYLQNYNIINEEGKYEKPIILADYANRWDRGIDNMARKVLFNARYVDGIGLPFDLNFARPEEEVIEFLNPAKSLKSIRNYQIGFTYLDKYNRETPVFSSEKATVKINKLEADNSTQLTARIMKPAPAWAESYKIYVKETANEYYNLALDRVYKAEDGNLWLAFPSSERNKVDEETFLILKKGADSDNLVENKARYKIIAIENNTPEFLKTKTRLLAQSDSTVFTGVSTPLAPDVKTFQIDKNVWSNQSSVNLADIKENMQFDFVDQPAVGASRYSKRYNVVNISEDTGTNVYDIVLETPVLTSEDWMYSSGTTSFTSTLKPRFYKAITRVKPEFEGKFFVKINGDSAANDFLNTSAYSDVQYRVSHSISSYYFSDTGAPGILEGTTHPVASTAPAEWEQYTSANYNVHIGDTTTPGIIYSAGDSNSGVESADGPRDWFQLLDFAPGTSGTPTSNWFIDQTYYAGTHPSSSSSNDSDPNHVTNGATNVFNYGKGIYEENGQQYIDLAFSMINPFAGAPNLAYIKNYGSSQAEIDFADINENYIWAIGSGSNPDHSDQSDVINNLLPGGKFRFANDTNEVIYTISDTVNIIKERRYNHTQWSLVQTAFDNWYATIPGSPGLEGDTGAKSAFNLAYLNFCHPTNRRVTYKIPIDKDINSQTLIGSAPVTAARRQDCAAAANENPVTIQFLIQKTDDDNDSVRSSNPAIFETEPKESIDLDLFYSTGDIFPTTFNIDTAEKWIPRGSIVTCETHPTLLGFSTRTIVTGFEQDDNGFVIIKFNEPLGSNPVGASELKFTRPDGSFTTISGSWYSPITTTPVLNFSGVPVFPNETGYYVYGGNLTQQKVGLSWFNCYSFGNGVESDRLRDDFNQVRLDKGVKVSTTTDEHYEEERRTSGLIYSGIYNSVSGVNSLNQFIQAEKITKDLNPTYGSIQKLFSRQTDLIAFCEDKVIRIQANKDAVFNADGNPNLIATNNVLGQTMPFSGDFGISNNPESFAADNYRVYFTDKQRNAVLRLSMDGLTEISQYGMGDYFSKEMSQYDLLIGSFDQDKKDYNLTLRSNLCDKGGFGQTISFNESVVGWVSFKSFLLEQGTSVQNKYYTFKNSLPWKHHDDTQPRNTFYGAHVNSTIEFLLNDAPDTIKSFKTINYEGSQARVKQESAHGTVQSNPGVGFYNLENKLGWKVTNISTDLQKGKVTEFVEKEGKWFNYIKGKESSFTNKTVDPNDFHIQGIGYASGLPPTVFGCLDPNAINYYPGANFDDGSCLYAGCTDPNSHYGATTFVHPTNGITYTATIDDGSCQYLGCMDQFHPSGSGVASTNYNANATIAGVCYWADSWECNTLTGGTIKNTTGTGTYLTLAQAQSACPPCGTQSVYGCKDPYAMNYDPDPNVCDDPTLCLPYYYYGTVYNTSGNIIAQGCMDDGTLTTTTLNADGYSIWPSYNGSQSVLHPTEILPCTISTYAPFNSYTYIDNTGSNNPTDPLYNANYGATVAVAADNATPATNWASNAAMGCGCIYKGCTDDTNSNYMPWATHDDISQCCIDGCLDPTANNYLVPGTDCFDTGGNAYTPWDGTTGDCWIGTDPGIPGLLPCCPTCDDGTYCTSGPTGPNSFCATLTTANYLTLNSLPWNGNDLVETAVPDSVFEECLEMNFTGLYDSTPNNGEYFSNADPVNYLGALSWNDDNSCCSFAFANLHNPYTGATGLYISPAGIFGMSGGQGYYFGSDDGYLNTNGRQDGDYISDLSGMQDFALQPNFERLVVHNQNITDFIHSEVDQSSAYFGLDMLSLFFTHTDLYTISLKTLPLNNMTDDILDLTSWSRGESIELVDCGVGEGVKVDRDSNPYMHSVVITNNQPHPSSPNFAAANIAIYGGGQYGYGATDTFIPGSLGQDGYGDHGNGYSYQDYALITQVPGLFDDGLGNVTRPQSFNSAAGSKHFPPHATSWNDGIYVPDNMQGLHPGTNNNPRYLDPNSGNTWGQGVYTMARLGRNLVFAWDGSFPGGGNAAYYGTPSSYGGYRYCNTRLYLNNLPNIEHIYIGPNWKTEFAQNYAAMNTFGHLAKLPGDAALFVKNCGNGNGVKIHLGSQARVNQFQKAYGTNDTNSQFYSTQGEAFFLAYFSADVEFVI